MIRVVLDTNVLVAGLQSRRGASFELLRRLRLGEYALVIANTILTEYEEVLKREGPKFGLTIATTDTFLDALCAGAEPFRLSGFWKPSLPDPDDEPVAQLAVEAKVDYLVTHNTKDFPAERLPGLRTLTPHEFLETLTITEP